MKHKDLRPGMIVAVRGEKDPALVVSTSKVLWRQAPPHYAKEVFHVRAEDKVLYTVEATVRSAPRANSFVLVHFLSEDPERRVTLDYPVRSIEGPWKDVKAQKEQEMNEYAKAAVDRVVKQPVRPTPAEALATEVRYAAEDLQAAVKVMRRRLGNIEALLRGDEDVHIGSTFLDISSEADRVVKDVAALQSLAQMSRRCNLVTYAEVRRIITETAYPQGVPERSKEEKP